MSSTKNVIKLFLAGLISIFGIYGILIEVNPDPFNLTFENFQANLNELNSTQDAFKEGVLYDVLDVVDGDTIKVSDLGTLRLIGIDTPETKDPRKAIQCFGAEASAKAQELLADKKVYLEFDKENSTKDRYNRTLAYVHTEDGLDFNAEMIKQGFAYAYKSFKHSKLEEFTNLETTARESQLGLWAPNTCNGIASPIEEK